MAEYIEREKVIAKCKEIVSFEWNHWASPVSWADAYEQFADDVENIPSADVVPVVRCKDCEDWICFMNNPDGTMFGTCKLCGNNFRNEGDFCSYGVRKYAGING